MAEPATMLRTRIGDRLAYSRDASHFALVPEAVAAVMARFDHVVESSRVGVRKPDPRIYALACEALGVTAHQCVYLDDLGINCKPAAVLGMRAIKVTDEEQALADLAEALGLGPGTF